MSDIRERANEWLIKNLAHDARLCTPTDKEERIIRGLLAENERLSQENERLKLKQATLGIKIDKWRKRAIYNQSELVRSGVENERLEKEIAQYKETECFTPPVTCSDNCNLLAELNAENKKFKDSNSTMHNMIMQVRKHTNAFDTPTAPTSQDIVNCIIRNTDHSIASAIRQTAEDCVEIADKMAIGVSIPNAIRAKYLKEEGQNEQATQEKIG